MNNEDGTNFICGSFDTEQEAAYAFNVGTVLLAPALEQQVGLNDLNLGMRLTRQQVINVKTVVSKQIRKELKLPINFKFPRRLKDLLNQTYEIVDA